MEGQGRLTDERYWDAYWAQHVPRLPLEVARNSGPQARAILNVFDRWLAEPAPERVLEVGGSPGQYLVYAQRLTGCRAAVLDFSPTGCAMTRQNFELLGIPVEIFECDLFSAPEATGRFDAVFSLGFVEHFGDLNAVAAAHSRLVAPGGILILGMPNLRGINGWFARRLHPNRYATHNVASMRFERWDSFEREIGLVRLFRGPIGGFEPQVFLPSPDDLPRWRKPSYLAARTLEVLARPSILRRFDHPLLSGYLIGVWRVPGSKVRWAPS